MRRFIFFWRQAASREAFLWRRVSKRSCGGNLHPIGKIGRSERLPGRQLFSQRRDTFPTLPRERFTKRGGSELLLFRCQKRREPSRIEKIQRLAKRRDIRKFQTPAVAQIRRGLERTVVADVIVLRQLSSVLRRDMARQIATSTIFAVAKNKSALGGRRDRDLANAVESGLLPAFQREFDLRTLASFASVTTMRASNGATCSRK